MNFVGGAKILRDRTERFTQTSRCEHSQPAIFSPNAMGNQHYKAD
jgi:hypothetical protein